MTAFQLLVYISAALLLQLAAAVGALVWRRREHVSTRLRLDEPDARAPRDAAWPGWREFRVMRRDFEDASNSQCSFYLQPVDGMPLPAFRPGQYLTFSVAVVGEGASAADTERGLTRCYSLSDRPDAASYRITIKRMPSPAGRADLPPGASSNHFHDRVQEGDVLKLKAPSGHFFLDPDATVPVVLIAGGIGITPLMSMLRWCVIAQPPRPVHLYYGVRSSADHAFKGVLEKLAASHPAFRLHAVYSSPGTDDVPGRDYQHAGRIDLELLRNTLPHGRHHFYVCGPPPMMQSLVPALREWGVERDDIHFEAFGTASARPAGPATNEPLVATSAAFEVRLRRSGRTLVWNHQDANLLDFLERHGVPVDSGCRSGSCGTCETKLIAGEVHYADRPDYDVAKGHCLLCIGKPQSPLELDA